MHTIIMPPIRTGQVAALNPAIAAPQLPLRPPVESGLLGSTSHSAPPVRAPRWWSRRRHGRSHYPLGVVAEALRSGRRNSRKRRAFAQAVRQKPPGSRSLIRDDPDNCIVLPFEPSGQLGSNPNTDSPPCVPTYTFPLATVGTVNLTAGPAALAPVTGLLKS